MTLIHSGLRLAHCRMIKQHKNGHVHYMRTSSLPVYKLEQNLTKHGIPTSLTAISHSIDIIQIFHANIPQYRRYKQHIHKCLNMNLAGRL